jgi:hypothetical protein
MSHLDDVLAASRRAAAKTAKPETGANLGEALADVRAVFVGDEPDEVIDPLRDVSIGIAEAGLIVVEAKACAETEFRLLHDDIVSGMIWMSFSYGTTDLSWSREGNGMRYVMTTTCDDLFFSVDARIEWADARYAERWKK